MHMRLGSTASKFSRIGERSIQWIRNFHLLSGTNSSPFQRLHILMISLLSEGMDVEIMVLWLSKRDVGSGCVCGTIRNHDFMTFQKGCRNHPKGCDVGAQQYLRRRGILFFFWRRIPTCLYRSASIAKSFVLDLSHTSWFFSAKKYSPPPTGAGRVIQLWLQIDTWIILQIDTWMMLRIDTWIMLQIETWIIYWRQKKECF